MKKEKIYTIIDIETTGGKSTRDRITEVAIIRHDGKKELDRWSSLINPETYIPAGITELTGISQEMVADAPKFYEVAKEIVERTEGCIFVAHNARFDYSFIREEFRRLGYTFTRKQLCTVRLSRQAFPGLASYSLGRLCTHFGITNAARHRAMGDAAATTILLEKILGQEENEATAEDLINLGIKEALLPTNLNLEKLHALPESSGVYYFHNIKGEVVYVGKSINIKKRVAEHFAKKTEKARRLQHHVHEVTYEVTGSELIALLLESFEIKRLRPKINRAQKIRNFPYIIHTWHNAQGYRCFGIDKVSLKERKQLNVISEYPKLGSAKGAMERARVHFELCDNYCKAKAYSSACFHFHLKQCYGACIQKEAVEVYNVRADQAAEYMTTVFDRDFFVLDQGRYPSEYAVVQVKQGNYYGFGYIDEEAAGDLNSLADVIKAFPGNPETRKIIQRFLAKPGAWRILEV